MTNERRWRKSLRYLRWISKTGVLLLFVVPVTYLVFAPLVPVESLFFGALSTSLPLMPINQAVCSIWINHFGNMNPGAWLLCPLGGVLTLLDGKGQIEAVFAILLFIIPIVLLGNVFCSWACPVGTMIDSFDKGVEKFLPNVEAKRNERSLRSRQNKNNRHEEKLKNFVCPSCPLSKAKSERFGVVANGIFASALLGSAVLRFPVFCAVCPMGIVSRGLPHLRSVTFITGAELAAVLELWAIPITAVLLSLRERRFWCKKLCPVGAVLNGVGTLNPFIKPKIREERCVMKGCPDECEDYHFDYCEHCRLLDDRKCEKVCPVDIKLFDNDSLARCTKCLECYIACDHNAVKVDLLGKPEVFRVGGFFRRLRAHRHKDQVTPLCVRVSAVMRPLEPTVTENDTIDTVKQRILTDTEKWFVTILDDQGRLSSVINEEAIERYLAENIKTQTQAAKDGYTDFLKTPIKNVIKFIEAESKKSKGLAKLINAYVPMSMEQNCINVLEQMEKEEKCLTFIVDSEGKPKGYLTTTDLRKLLFQI